MATINIPIVGHYEKKDSSGTSNYNWTVPNQAYDNDESTYAKIATNMYGKRDNHMYFHAPIPANVAVETLALDMLLRNYAKNSSMTIDFSITAGTGADDQVQLVAETKSLTMNTQQEKVWFSLTWDSLSDAEKAAIEQNKENLCIEVFVSQRPTRAGDREMYEIKVSTQAKELYTITTIASPTDGGTISGGGTFLEDTVITLNATANNGYQFVSWNDNVTTATRTVTVTQNMTYTAYFEPLSKIYNGTTRVPKVYIGTTPIKAVYIGTTKVL